MNFQEILFCLFAVVAVISAAMMVVHRNPVYSAIFLIVTLFALAGFYVLLGAPFVASVHIIVYAGAIMVLFLFVIMLLNLKRDPIRERSKFARRAIATTLVSIFLFEFGILIAASYSSINQEVPAINGSLSPGSTLLGLDSSATANLATTGNTANIGRQLFTTYLLPFEIASILLLVAIVGAVILAKRKLVP